MSFDDVLDWTGDEPDYDQKLGEAIDLFAEIEDDLEAIGPLARYLDHAREQAQRALLALAYIPPSDTEGILQAQAEVRAYRSLVAWINVSRAEGEAAYQSTKLLGTIREEQKQEIDSV